MINTALQTVINTKERDSYFTNENSKKRDRNQKSLNSYYTGTRLTKHKKEKPQENRRSKGGGGGGRREEGGSGEGEERENRRKKG